MTSLSRDRRHSTSADLAVNIRGLKSLDLIAEVIPAQSHQSVIIRYNSATLKTSEDL